jgi:hypothetical protein
MTWFEIPAVVIVLGVIGVAVIRAFVSSRSDSIDVFMKRGMASRHERR